MQYPYENLENFTLPSLFDRSINLFGKHEALGWANQKAMTYDEVNQKVMAMVKLLQENGISKGDKVVLLSQNMPNWAVAYFSITYFGAVVVPVLPDFHKADVHHILRHSEAKAVFVSEEHLATIEEDDNSDIKFVIKLDTLEIIKELTHKSYISKLKEKITSSSAKEITSPDEDDLASLLYTSGTTGHSKGVMLSHKNLVTNALSAFDNVILTTDDVTLSILPLAHTFECTVGLTVPFIYGSHINYIDKAPTPSVLLKAFASVRPTMMLTVPLIIEKIYKNKVLAKFNSSFITKNLYKIPFFRKLLHKIAGKKLMETFGGRMRFFGIGGAPLSNYVAQFLYEGNFPYIIGYGLTETAPILTGGTVIGQRAKLYSAGKALHGVELKIVEGEIYAKSPSVMLGYYKDKEKTAEVMDGDWFLTGDLGYIDDEGYLFISGRSKNVIIGSGGENIYPEQIEATINQNEAVLDALMMMQDGKLIARIHLDYELLDEKFNANKNSDAQVKEDIANLLEEMRILKYHLIVKWLNL
jgi:long-chain acyl-CoA synthetase